MHSELPDGSIKRTQHYNCLVVFSRVRCAKVIGSTSSEGFPVYKVWQY